MLGKFSNKWLKLSTDGLEPRTEYEIVEVLVFFPFYLTGISKLHFE